MTTTWPGGGVDGRRGAEFELFSNRRVINVCEYADEATLRDDMYDATQEALDDAPQGYTIDLPPPRSLGETEIWTCSQTLKVKAYTRFRGPGHNVPAIQFTNGSPMTLIREGTFAEGNTQGASGLWITDLQILGNGETATAPVALDVGNSNGGNLNLNYIAGVRDCFVSECLGGHGMRFNTNAASIAGVWSNHNKIGIEAQGNATNYVDVKAEGNLLQDLIISSGSDIFHGIQTEHNYSDTESVRFNGSDMGIYGLRVGIFANCDYPVYNAAGAARNKIDDYLLDDQNGAYAFLHSIYSPVASNVCTGQQKRIPLWIDHANQSPSWFADTTNNTAIKIGVGAITGVPPVTPVVLTYATSMKPSSLGIQKITITNGTAFTMIDPTDGVPGNEFTLSFNNTSGGAAGVISWQSTYKLDGAFTGPADGAYRSISFFHNGSAFVEKSRS